MKELLLGLVPKVLAKATPTLKDALHEGVKALAIKARESDNPYDDMAVSMIAGVLGISLKG